MLIPLINLTSINLAQVRVVLNLVQRCISKVIGSSVNIPSDNITRLVKHLYESLQFLFLSHISESARNCLRNTI